MGKYSETRYANMIPTFEPAPLPASEATAAQKSNMRVYETFADLPATSTSKGNTAFVKATNKSIADKDVNKINSNVENKKHPEENLPLKKKTTPKKKQKPQIIDNEIEKMILEGVFKVKVD